MARPLRQQRPTIRDLQPRREPRPRQLRDPGLADRSRPRRGRTERGHAGLHSVPLASRSRAATSAPAHRWRATTAAGPAVDDRSTCVPQECRHGTGVHSLVTSRGLMPPSGPTISRISRGAVPGRRFAPCHRLQDCRAGAHCVFVQDHGQGGAPPPAAARPWVVDGGAHLGDPGPPCLLGRCRDHRLPLGVGLGGPLALPAHDRPFRLPRDDGVDAQLCGRLDGQFVPVALGKGLDQHQPDVGPVLRRDGRTLHGQFRRALRAVTVPVRRLPAPSAMSTGSPTPRRLTVTAWRASAPSSTKTEPGPVCCPVFRRR